MIWRLSSYFSILQTTTLRFENVVLDYLDVIQLVKWQENISRFSKVNPSLIPWGIGRQRKEDWWWSRPIIRVVRSPGEFQFVLIIMTYMYILIVPPFTFKSMPSWTINCMAILSISHFPIWPPAMYYLEIFIAVSVFTCYLINHHQLNGVKQGPCYYVHRFVGQKSVQGLEGLSGLCSLTCGIQWRLEPSGPFLTSMFGAWTVTGRLGFQIC